MHTFEKKLSMCLANERKQKSNQQSAYSIYMKKKATHSNTVSWVFFLIFARKIGRPFDDEFYAFLDPTPRTTTNHKICIILISYILVAITMFYMNTICSIRLEHGSCKTFDKCCNNGSMRITNNFNKILCCPFPLINSKCWTQWSALGRVKSKKKNWRWWGKR